MSFNLYDLLLNLKKPEAMCQKIDNYGQLLKPETWKLREPKLLHIELRLLAYIRLLSGEIHFPSPDGMRASTPFLLRGS